MGQVNLKVRFLPRSYLMKFSTVNLALLAGFASLTLSSVSCSLVLECETGKSKVLSEFTLDTQATLKKLSDIEQCGQNHLKNLFISDRDAYRKCINDLHLPDSYENEISFFLSFAFEHDVSFKKAMKTAASSVCSGLNHAHFLENDDIKKIYYKVSATQSDLPIQNTSSSYIDNSFQSKFYDLNREDKSVPKFTPKPAPVQKMVSKRNEIRADRVIDYQPETYKSYDDKKVNSSGIFDGHAYFYFYCFVVFAVIGMVIAVFYLMKSPNPNREYPQTQVNNNPVHSNNYQQQIYPQNNYFGHIQNHSQMSVSTQTSDIPLNEAPPSYEEVSRPFQYNSSAKVDSVLKK